MRLSLAVLIAVVFASAATTTALENEYVRVLSATQAAQEKTPMHRHDFNRVVIYLDDGRLQATTPDGQAKVTEVHAGQVSWAVAGAMHSTANLTPHSVRLIEIELKQEAPKVPAVSNSKLDPVLIDPKHNVLLFENAQVRVFRSSREGGGTEMMHAHTGRGRATVSLTDMPIRVKLADGSESTGDWKQGEVRWSGPVVHASTNLGKREIAMIVVEVK